MKFVIAFIAFCLLIPAAAQATPIAPERAEAFYKACVAQPDPRMLLGSQDLFCKCTTQKLVQNMTFEDAQAYVKQDRTAVNKYLITAYAPCMEIPVHDDVFKACKGQNVPDAQCQCLASNIGKYTQAESVRLLGSVLSQYPNAFDPVAAIKQTPEFEAQLDNIARQCAQSSQ